MFGKFKKADTAEAQNHALTDAARDAAHAAATSLRKPQIVTEIQRPAAQVAADDKDVKRRQRLDEIKTEMHSRLLDNLNLAELETGPVTVWCRSFDHVMCSKGEELWAQEERMNSAKMQCELR